MAFASFDSRRGSAPMAEINMVPLIDVMLVLLVIFIVTAPLLTHAVRIELPQASARADVGAPERRIEVTIDAAGLLHWNEDVVTRAELQRRLAQEAARPMPPELRLRADRRAAYRPVAETLADASRAGLTRIGFVSDPDAAADR